MTSTEAQTTGSSSVNLRELMEVGAHFGHQTAKWNPKMKKYIHTSRNGVYIINLQQTVHLFKDALEFVKRISASGQKVLFVGTKRQAKDTIAEEANRAGQPFVNERWIGGCLTNYHTIKRSVAMMKQLRKMEDEGKYGIRKKKEILLLRKKLQKLETYYTGIKDMTDVPGALFVIDPHREYIAVSEALVLGIPIIATLDTNCDPDKIQFPIPGNDDSMRAIKLYASKIADAVLEGSKSRRANLEAISGPNDPTQEIKVDPRLQVERTSTPKLAAATTPAVEVKAENVAKEESKTDEAGE